MQPLRNKILYLGLYLKVSQRIQPEQRAANQAAFDRKQAEAARRLSERQRRAGQASDQSLLPAPAVSR